MADPKRHHYVPQMLLRNFAGPDGSLKVFAIDRAATYTSKPLSLGQVKGGHARIRRDGTIDRAALEHWMSSLEGAAAGDIRALVESKALTVAPEDYPSLSWLASLQFYRNRAVMGYLKSELANAGMTGPDLDIQTAILDVGVQHLLGAWEASKDINSRPKDRWDSMVVILESLRWDVLRYQNARLIVSDGFAAQYGVRPEHVDKYNRTERNWAKHGLLVPQHEAAAFTIPLTPDVALHLHPGQTRKYISAQRVNQRTVFAARAFVAMPDNWSLPNSLVGDVADWVDTQRFVRSMIAKNM
ncbi:DUF4238 domain-containing protein [Cryobacterium gelidum]|uniref:DUF4238 domain-containing protein n=1 Tax=Cryobacterium gelidum TaxID=1259164 RepID=A0A4R9ASM6_9MICO|nr:DUF4238 domain-containing protein [Cryobacterium gelidum]TFD68186.1 DUF4238 domain-containing protein [Cryobacterium gelidum]